MNEFQLNVDGSFYCWKDHFHFDYSPNGFAYLKNHGDTSNIMCWSEPGYYTADQMYIIMERVLQMMDKNIKMKDFKFLHQYPVNDAYGRISSDVWVANIEPVYA